MKLIPGEVIDPAFDRSGCGYKNGKVCIFLRCPSLPVYLSSPSRAGVAGLLHNRADELLTVHVSVDCHGCVHGLARGGRGAHGSAECRGVAQARGSAGLPPSVSSNSCPHSRPHSYSVSG